MAYLRRKLLCTVAAAAVAAAGLVSVPGTASAQSATASGEVRRVDASAGRVTIKHGAISSLDLPAMTLVYEADPALLQAIRPGDKVNFTASRENDKYVVTQIRK